MSFDVHPEHIYQSSAAELRRRARRGGKSSAEWAMVAARDRARQASLDALAHGAVDHADAAAALVIWTQSGLLDRWLDGVYGRGIDRGYSRAVQRSRRGQDLRGKAPDEASLYGRTKARVTAWIQRQDHPFTSGDLARALSIDNGMACNYVTRAWLAGLVTRTETGEMVRGADGKYSQSAARRYTRVGAA